MTSESVHYLSFMDVSARLRSRELKPTTLTETILARIGQYDGTLKSYTTVLADRERRAFIGRSAASGRTCVPVDHRLAYPPSDTGL